MFSFEISHVISFSVKLYSGSSFNYLRLKNTEYHNYATSSASFYTQLI